MWHLLLTKLYTRYFKNCKDANCSQKLQSSRGNVCIQLWWKKKRERERNAVKGTLMKCCGCAEERKAYFRKRRVRVKTIKHYRKDTEEGGD